MANHPKSLSSVVGLVRHDYDEHMKPNRATTGFLLLVVAKFFGLALVYLPPQLIAQYERAKEAGGNWSRRLVEN